MGNVWKFVGIFCKRYAKCSGSGGLISHVHDLASTKLHRWGNWKVPSRQSRKCIGHMGVILTHHGFFHLFLTIIMVENGKTFSLMDYLFSHFISKKGRVRAWNSFIRLDCWEAVVWLGFSKILDKLTIKPYSSLALWILMSVSSPFMFSRTLVNIPMWVRE